MLQVRNRPPDIRAVRVAVADELYSWLGPIDASRGVCLVLLGV